MALLEETNRCALCEREIGGGGGSFVPIYFCAKCYSRWRTEYLARESWVRFLENIEKQRRKRRNRLLKSVGLPYTVNTVAGEEL